jgi:hypothetical protein
VIQGYRQERRVHRRAGPFEGAWSGASGGHDVRIADVSEGGCFVESLSSVPAAPQDRVTVAIALTPSRDVCVEGYVTAVYHGIGFGVQFFDLGTEQRTEIREAVRALLSGDNAMMVTISQSVESSAGPGAGAVIESTFAM